MVRATFSQDAEPVASQYQPTMPRHRFAKHHTNIEPLPRSESDRAYSELPPDTPGDSMDCVKAPAASTARAQTFAGFRLRPAALARQSALFRTLWGSSRPAGDCGDGRESKQRPISLTVEVG